MTAKKSRNFLSHYPRVFLFQIVFSTIAWLIFFTLFAWLGKQFAETDTLGKICQLIFGREKGFEQYFLGTGGEEKKKLLNIALYFILIIIILKILALLLNCYLWSKDRYLENNNFYLHNRGVFLINSLIHIASAFLLTFSLTSALTAILSLLFITLNTRDFWIPQKSPAPQIENSFSWKNSYIRKMFLYSAIAIFVVPLVIGYFQSFHEAAKKSSEGFAKAYQEMINSSNVFKGFADLIIKANYSLFHWVILIWFAKSLISQRTKEFQEFWTKINGVEKRVIKFKHYYYYQASWAQANKQTSIKLGDYKYLEDSPNFLSQEYLEGDLDIDQFAQRNLQVVQYIKFYEHKVMSTSKRNFLNYCLFNEFKSWADCLQTQALLKKIKPV